MSQTYLGDGVYAGYDGYSVILSTNDGIRDTNIIYLEPQVWHALERFVLSLAANPERADGGVRE